MINNYFDKVYCVNLDRRIDKWDESQEEFKKHNITVERFSAIDGATIQGNGRISSNEMGCALSHLTILREMIKNKYSRILILEDDVEFMENVQGYFNKSIDRIPIKWDMLYLGGNHIEPPIPINETISKISRTYTTSHYGITLEMAQKVIRDIEEAHEPVDLVYTRFHKINACYSFNPAIAWQRPGFSDIQNSYKDYRYCMKPQQM